MYIYVYMYVYVYIYINNIYNMQIQHFLIHMTKADLIYISPSDLGKRTGGIHGNCPHCHGRTPLLLVALLVRHQFPDLTINIMFLYNRLHTQ